MFLYYLGYFGFHLPDLTSSVKTKTPFPWSSRSVLCNTFTDKGAKLEKKNAKNVSKQTRLTTPFNGLNTTHKNLLSPHFFVLFFFFFFLENFVILKSHSLWCHKGHRCRLTSSADKRWTGFGPFLNLQEVQQGITFSRRLQTSNTELNMQVFFSCTVFFSCIENNNLTVALIWDLFNFHREPRLFGKPWLGSRTIRTSPQPVTVLGDTEKCRFFF